MKQYEDYLRWLYRGGHPNAFARLQNRGSAIAFAAGIVPNRAGALQIPGRRSGHIISFPVVIADFEGERYLGDYSFIAFWISPLRNSDGRHDGKFSTIPQAKMNVS